MWFLQARCGLLFAIINHNHNQWQGMPPGLNINNIRPYICSLCSVFCCVNRHVTHVVWSSKKILELFHFIANFTSLHFLQEMSHQKDPNEMKEDVYIVVKSQSGKFTLQVASEYEPEPTWVDKMLNRFASKGDNTAPHVNFEIPYLSGCFCVILGSKCTFYVQRLLTTELGWSSWTRGYSKNK